MIPIRNQNFVNVIALILTASVCLSLNSRGEKTYIGKFEMLYLVEGRIVTSVFIYNLVALHICWVWPPLYFKD